MRAAPPKLQPRIIMTVDFGRAARGMACFVSIGVSAACLFGAPAAADDVPPGVFFAKDHALMAQQNGAPGAAKAQSPFASTAAPGQSRVAASHPAGGSIVRASWYGGGERLSRRTASGQHFNPWGMTAAHRTLPLGTRLQLSLGERSVVVTVNDRGPARSTGRTLDLSRGAARALGFERAGQASLRMTVLG
jgi:rare lipoprotein A